MARRCKTLSVKCNRENIRYDANAGHWPSRCNGDTVHPRWKRKDRRTGNGTFQHCAGERSSSSRGVGRTVAWSHINAAPRLVGNLILIYLRGRTILKMPMRFADGIRPLETVDHGWCTGCRLAAVVRVAAARRGRYMPHLREGPISRLAAGESRRNAR
jgi:hypothetical protein